MNKEKTAEQERANAQEKPKAKERAKRDKKPNSHERADYQALEGVIGCRILWNNTRVSYTTQTMDGSLSCFLKEKKMNDKCKNTGNTAADKTTSPFVVVIAALLIIAAVMFGEKILFVSKANIYIIPIILVIGFIFYHHARKKEVL